MSRRQRTQTESSKPLLADCWPGDVRLVLMGATDVVAQLLQLLSTSANERSLFSDPYSRSAQQLREMIRDGLETTIAVLSDLSPQLGEDSIREGLVEVQRAIARRAAQIREDENQVAIRVAHLRDQGAA